MKVWTVGNIFALDFLEEELTVFHGTEETPKSTSVNLKLVAGLHPQTDTKIAVAASNSWAKVR